jgi:ubiquinone/menaquinone biosynthesis C-methylase UbiE
MLNEYRRQFLASAVAVLSLGISSSAQQPRDPEAYAKTLEGAERVARMQVPKVIESLGVKPGDKIADIGSGSGLFTRPLAKTVAPNGVVYAVDIDAGLLKIVERTSAESGLKNVKTVLAATDDPKLPEPVDLAFICDALHHIGNQAAYFKTLAKYVKPRGFVAVIDFSEKWPAGHESMRYSAKDLDGWLKAAGFSPVRSFDFLDNSFFLLYARR